MQRKYKAIKANILMRKFLLMLSFNWKNFSKPPKGYRKNFLKNVSETQDKQLIKNASLIFLPACLILDSIRQSSK